MTEPGLFQPQYWNQSPGPEPANRNKDAPANIEIIGTINSSIMMW